MNIITGQIAHPDVNAAMSNFKTGWPGSFYDPLGKLIVTMDVKKKHVLVGNERVNGLLAISREINFDNIYRHMC